MSQPSETLTIRYYDDHADEYVRGTVGVNMESLYMPFLSGIVEGGRILDAGCGSGRDSKSFLDRGYSGVSIDASRKMVDATTELTGRLALQMTLQDVSFTNEFHGIWACASLLHIPLLELAEVLGRFGRALRPSGICYSSFKEGKGERNQNGRLFTDMDEPSIHSMVDGLTGLEIVQLWRTDDLRPGRSDRWLNAILRKVDK